MATDPIAAGFAPANPDNLPWYDEINSLLDGYQRALHDLANPEDDALTVLVKLMLVQTYQNDLSAHGVTVCGGFGHA